jgi:16S rRNA (cytidine1402-2'-O)-methyltransferase
VVAIRHNCKVSAFNSSRDFNFDFGVANLYYKIFIEIDLKFMLLKPGLYIISTPIGNFDDITIRAIDTLKKSTIILCEDTRISRKLLDKYKIDCRLLVYNDHSDLAGRNNIRSLIDQGEIVSLISDAGTPLISDPGYKLVRELKNLGYLIDIVPGVSAPIAALTLSGLETDSFLFGGFLPKTVEGKEKTFSNFAKLEATLIFFDTAKRLSQSLSVALRILGNREICVARELTKFYQEAKTGPLAEIAEFYQNNPVKGEIVLIISRNSIINDMTSIQNSLNELLASHISKGMTAKTVTAIAHQEFQKFYSKKDIYNMANAIKESM